MNQQAQKAKFESGAYTYSAYWNGKEYSLGHRFIRITGVGNKREYTIVTNAQGSIIESQVASTALAQAAVEALGWR